VTSANRHGNSAAWVERESLRRFPLDLSARVAWVREMAESAATESDRHAIYAVLARVKDGRA
jgi:hypothetical protein